MKLSIEELKAFESNPSNNFLTRGQMMDVVRELIAIRELQTVPVAFTGSGSLSAIKVGHEGYIWGTSAEAHPIELYTTPRPAHTEQMNSPAIPDGWKLVPIEPTQEMVDAHISGMQSAGFIRAYREMLAAAPKPDGTITDEGTKSDGWIKCGDQLPPDDDFVLVWPTPDFGVDLHVGQYMKFHKKGAGWFAQVNEQNYGIEWYPITVTHWMKLPAAPKPESEL